MLETYVTFTRKKLIFLVLLFICILLICNQIYLAGNIQGNALTNTMRLDYLKNTGYVVIEDMPSTKNVILPEIFSDVYSNYNDLQLSAGYDLSLYKGCEVTIYSYQINAPGDYDGTCFANMIVYNNRIIGGDVSSAALGGFMLPLGKNG